MVGGPGKKRQRGCREKRRCLNSDGGISQHAIEKVADSKAFIGSAIRKIDLRELTCQYP